MHISVGDLLREEVKNGTPAGTKAKDFMDKGVLVRAAGACADADALAPAMICPAAVAIDLRSRCLVLDDAVVHWCIGAWQADCMPDAQEC